MRQPASLTPAPVTASPPLPPSFPISFSLSFLPSLPPRNPNLLKGVYGMGFNRPSKIQEQALPILLSDPPCNLIAQSQSGTGKTAAFVLAMLSRVDPDKHYPQVCGGGRGKGGRYGVWWREFVSRGGREGQRNCVSV